VLYTQTPNVLPLYMEMVPENKKGAVLQNLFENVEITNDCHLNTGILGTRYILDTLTQYGRADLAYRLATQTTYPSWGYMIKEGATTLWERWEYMRAADEFAQPYHVWQRGCLVLPGSGRYQPGCCRFWF